MVSTLITSCHSYEVACSYIPIKQVYYHSDMSIKIEFQTEVTKMLQVMWHIPFNIFKSH